MLVEFKFKNFLSFKEDVVFQMTKVAAFKEHIKTHVITTDKGFDLLKSSAIYGANGSGKSNLIKAFGAMRSMVFTSFSNSLLEEDKKPVPDFVHKLNSKSEKSPTMFEVSFLVGNSIYRYGFEIKSGEVKREWLYRKIEREVNLFYRKGSKFEINSESFKEGESFKKFVNSNVLFISHLAQNNQTVSSKVYRWFKSTNVISGLYDSNYNKFTVSLLLNNPNFKKWSTYALRYLEITNVEAREDSGEILTYHNKYDENNLLIDSVPFNELMESEGTKKLINTLGPIYDTLSKGRLLWIDELDSKLHPNLSKKLIELFHQFNRKGAQLVFTGQDSNLLDKDLFRRDQIWFTQKDQFGSSTLYSMSEFDTKTVRNTSSYNKKYLANEFGSADTIELTKVMLDLIYE